MVLYFNIIALGIMSDIWSALKELFDLWVSFFSSIGYLISFLWNTMLDWFKFGNILSSAIEYLPNLYEFLPDLLVPFASGCLVLSIILLILGRNH